MTELTPWWKALKIRAEILNASGQIDDVQMSLFQAVYGSGPERPLYADAAYYGEITHPTDRLIDLLTEIAIRIGGGPDYLKARAVTRLDQGMGGGKSHACIGAYHLADNPEALMRTEIGQQVAARAQSKIGKPLPDTLNSPHVVVLPCDNMTPGAPVKDLDGPAINLYERFLWRLFSRDYTLFERYQPYFNDKSKIAEALKAVNHPVLIVIDEVLDYIGNGLDGANKPDLAAQDMAFLRALLDAANDTAHVSVLVVMIASETDTTALSEAARDRREDLNSLLDRNGLPATVTDVADFASILRRRLFDGDPANEVLSNTAAQFRPTLDDPGWVKHVWDSIASDWRSNWDKEVAACYPFHPMLMAIAREEWSKVTGFQRVRSTIRIFAASVFALQQRGKAGEWVPTLIGPGDLPLSDSAVREALLGSGLVEDTRTISNYRALAEIDVVSNDETSGAARQQDINREPLLWREANPRAAERAATFIFLASIVGTIRPRGGRGATAPETKAATSVPNAIYTITDADEVVNALVNPDRGMSAVEVAPGQGNNKPARFFLSTRLTHRMLVNDIKKTITPLDRDKVIAETVERLMNSGPFSENRFVPADPPDSHRTPKEILTTQGIDTAHTTRLVVLDPAAFSLRNGMEKATLEALSAAMGLANDADALPVQWASSAVFAIVNTQRRALTRTMAVEFIARQRALAAPEVQNDAELKMTAINELSEAKTKFETHLKRAFQHVAYLAQPDPEAERYLDQFTFDDEHSSALDGTIVWKRLSERDKTFDSGHFNAGVLLFSLRENDYGRSLADIRAAFYSAPRLPLLYNGDRDLQHAIYDAVTEGRLAIVDSAGNEVVVTAANQVNVSSTGLRLAKPQAAEADPPAPSNNEDGEGHTANSAEGTTSGGEAQHGTPSSPTAPDPESPAAERQLQFSFTQSLLGNADAADVLARVFKALYLALDEQEVSFLQSTLAVVGTAANIDSVATILDEAGIAFKAKDM
ncbi:AAA family ATPase [Mycolicibacterium conceptionense]|uniref:DUF499 domain-containing protein n=1 Tax=Mycolicibacterium conceptionense TaxID=451644 RepID=UPI0007EAF733|nr:DUF499 domain-containing protein [Mycolicibacterium conceptionense]OBB05372.1 AAA family ATPase [Mycolicibacterium conceptionense]OBF01275.1 AAA family ATPase [Mycolicibacterium conceptionense]